MEIDAKLLQKLADKLYTTVDKNMILFDKTSTVSHLSTQDIRKVFENEDYLSELHDTNHIHIYDEVYDEIYHALKDIAPNEPDINDIVTSIMENNTNITIEEESDVIIPINLLVDMGTSDYEYTNVTKYDETEKFFYKKPITWLIESQGYTVEDYFDKNKRTQFLDSIRDEINDAYYDGSNALTFIFAMPLLDAVTLCATKQPTITIPKNVKCGLVDFCQGGGSLINIELEKDITIDINDIHRRIDQDMHYGVRDIYGFDEEDGHDYPRITWEEME